MLHVSYYLLIKKYYNLPKNDTWMGTIRIIDYKHPTCVNCIPKHSKPKSMSSFVFTTKLLKCISGSRVPCACIMHMHPQQAAVGLVP